MTDKELYDEAKEAYYNGEPIMTDLEFDRLESQLNLENKGYIGTHHQKSYTVKHPFIMGSLSKIQIKEDENGKVDFKKYADEVKKYLDKSKNVKSSSWGFQTTPKLDGCSFEVVIDNKGKLVSVSTRGDGEYGKDIKVWFEQEWKRNFIDGVYEWIDTCVNDDEYNLLPEYFVVRGECLIMKSLFDEKYSDKFTMPRSFVAGLLGQDWEGTPEQIEMRNDLSWVCYDFREVYSDGLIMEVPYQTQFTPGEQVSPMNFGYDDLNDFDEIYDYYGDFRERTQWPLDGFVIKPNCQNRLGDYTRARQEDCVAIKFKPEIVETKVKSIEWNVGKTGEYYPVGICEDVILGGKKVNRVSLHNLDYLKSNHVGIGSSIRISLAGDIIPFCYEILTHSDEYDLPKSGTWIKTDEKSGCEHLMKEMTDQDELYIKFINSVKVLKIDGIGEKVASKLFEIKNTDNIIQLMDDESLNLIEQELGQSKSTSNIIKGLKERRTKLTMNEIIESLGFDNCGPKNSLWLAKKLSGIDVSYDGIPNSIVDIILYDVRLDDVKVYMKRFNVPYLTETKENKIPIIMTGEPSNTSYKTKKLWLNAHPQYVETTSWKEVKILFTNDLEGSSSKMTKAKKNNVEIKLYED